MIGLNYTIIFYNILLITKKCNKEWLFFIYKNFVIVISIHNVKKVIYFKSMYYFTMEVSTINVIKKIGSYFLKIFYVC